MISTSSDLPENIVDGTSEITVLNSLSGTRSTYVYAIGSSSLSSGNGTSIFSARSTYSLRSLD